MSLGGISAAHICGSDLKKIQPAFLFDFLFTLIPWLRAALLCGRVFSCLIPCQSWGWWERRRRTFLWFLPQHNLKRSTQRHIRAFFTLSSWLFPSLFILLVKLYLRHNYLIATTCLPNRENPTVCSSGVVFWGFWKLLFKCNTAFENDSHLWPVKVVFVCSDWAEHAEQCHACSHGFKMGGAIFSRFSLCLIMDTQIGGSEENMIDWIRGTTADGRN